MTFIQELYKKRSHYSDPDQATMQENSLEKLSSGIYTEGERFIFELLQNAVDAHSASDCLSVSIFIQDGYFVFMHNGDAFTNDDIEGICFVGRKGEKVRNAKKIGYKGIGFKSVFGISSKVYIHTASQCFRFDKDYWRSYWNENWNPSFGPKPADLSEYTMPWQVIPIESEVPISLDEKNANVSTYIAIEPEDEQKLADSIKELMQSCRFLIFLKDSNIKMSFTHNGIAQCSLEKRSLNGEVILYLNGIEDSRWMVYQNPDVPLNLSEEQRRRIEKHKSTPDKLKNATSFDLSFAIAIDGGKLKRADNAVIYTYLPTSYSFGEGFPFLVNANFITDEGRQHLDVDAEWNKMLISKIPEEYLTWVASFSKKYSNYYEVLPKKSYGSGNDLLKMYEEAMKYAIEKIAFIPSAKCKDLLKVDDSIFDRMNIAEAITPQLFIAHINRIYGRRFSGENNIIKNEGNTILKSYGVFDFDKKKFKDLFEDSQAIAGIVPESDAKLINLLCVYHSSLSATDKEEAEFALSETKFILNQDENLYAPQNLCLSALNESSYNSDTDYINETVLSYLSDSSIEWLKGIGVTEPSNTSIIDTGKIFEDSYINLDNAIEIGRYIYNLSESGALSDSQYVKLRKLKLLTTTGTLVSADSSYLSNQYLPSLPLEEDYAKDWYVSPKYLSQTGNKEKFKQFFEKIGVSQNASIDSPDVRLGTMLRDKTINSSRHDYLNQLFEDLKTIPGEWDWENRAMAHFTSIRILDEAIDNYSFSKKIWKNIFENASLDIDALIADIHVIKFHSWDRQCYTIWMLHNQNILPTTLKTCKSCNDVYSNSIPHIQEIAFDILPVLDYDKPLSDTWQNTLELKTSLQLDDYLQILSNLSNRTNYDLQNMKFRIETIYSILLEQIPIFNEQQREKINTWAESNKLLSVNGEFSNVSSLCYISLEGFSARNCIYIGHQFHKENVVPLLSLFGVRVFTEDNVSPTFDNDIPNTDIPTRLLSTLPALAVLARDCNERKTYQEFKEILQKKIENTQFFQCNKIKLAYDDSGDTISKISFAQEGKFYFTGELRPAKIEPLLHPLCTYLGISGKERELFVIMTEPEFSGIIEYLEDKEYDVSDIKTEMIPIPASKENAVSVGGQIGGGIDKNNQIADNNEAKALVLAKLEKEGFNINDIDYNLSVIKGVTRGKMEYPLVVKSCKNQEHRVWINPDEWQQLFKPNSMLWLHFGGGDVAPIKAHELFTYQDKLTLSFDTVNLMMDDRIHKIMEVLHYFNKVNLDLATLNPNKHRADNLNDYLFSDNNAENSDLDDNVEL
jgi:hypothetical protein